MPFAVIYRPSWVTVIVFIYTTKVSCHSYLLCVVVHFISYNMHSLGVVVQFIFFYLQILGVMVYFTHVSLGIHSPYRDIMVHCIYFDTRITKALYI